MRPHRMVLVLLCALAALVATALPNSAGGAVTPASLRLAVATAGGSSVDLALDGHVRAARIAAATASGWQSLKPGSHTITVLDRHHAVLARVSLRLASGNRRTVVLLPSGRSFHLLVVAETSPVPGIASAVIVDAAPAASGATATLAGHVKTLTTGHAVTISATPGDDGAALPLSVARGTSTVAGARVDPIGGALSLFLLVPRAGHATLVALPRAAAGPSQAAPAVQGAARVGSTLTCQPVTVRNAAATAYAWLVDGVATADRAATRTTLVSDAGHVVACRATITGPGGTLARRSLALGIPPAPAVSITAASAGDTLLTDASVSWTTLGAVDETTCSLNGGAAATCTSPLLLSGLAPGPYSVDVTVSGPGGVVHATTGTWNVVATPTVTITSRPPAVTDSETVDLSYTATSGAEVTCVLDAQPCPSAFTGLPTGEHAVTITATGNGAQDTKVVAWTQVPFLTLVSGPPAHTTADSATVAFATNGVAACALDGVLPAPCATVSGLTSGAHDLVVTATGNGGTTATPLAVHWVVDPTVTIVAPPNPTTDSSPTIAFATTPAGGVTTTCALDGSPASPCPSPVAYQNLALGQHTLVVTATGGAETIAATGSVSWLENPPAPTVAITSAPAARSTETTARITYLPSGLASTTACTLDGSPLTPCPTSLKLDGVAAGTHTFTVTVGNVSGQNSASTTWIVDPTVTITTPPSDPTTATSASIAYATTPTTGLTVTCTLDGAPYSPCQSPIILSGLALGSHVVAVTVTGGAGSTPVTASVSWVQNPPAPTVTITSQTATAIVFATTGVVTTRTCTLDATTAPCTSPFALAGLASGTHAFSVTVGNVTGSATATASAWVVQHAVAITSSPASPTIATTAAIAFAATPGAGVTYSCTLDTVSAPCTSPATYNGLTVQSHAFSVTATGGAGSTPVTATTTWVQNPPAPTVTITSQTPTAIVFATTGVVTTRTCTLDATTAPCTSPFALAGLASGTHAFSVTVGNVTGSATATASAWVVQHAVAITSSPASPTIATTAAIAFAATPGAGVTYSCTLDTVSAPCTSPATYNGLTVQSHAFSVTATGGAGSTPVTATTTWVQNPPAPTVTITSQTPTAIVFATTGVVTTRTCTLDATTAPCTSPFALAGLASGTHAFSVTVGNVTGSATATASAWVVQHAVAITSSPASPTIATTAAIAFAATPGAGVTYSCTLDTVSAPCTSPATYNGLTVQSHAFSVTATGGAGSTPVTATTTWVQNPPAPTVAITSAPPARTTATTTSVGWAASGIVATTACTLDGVALASCTSPIAATVGSGTHALAITVGNVSGGNTATATWIVDPTVTITTPPTDTIATSASIPYTTTPAGGLTVTCTLNGAVHAPCASPIVLTGLAVGTYTVAITAAGAPASQPATATATWKVLPPVPTVSITSPATGGHQTATTAQVSFTLGGGPASSVTCQVDAAAASACTSPYTASLPASGTHTVTVVASSLAGSATATTTIVVDPTATLVLHPTDPTTAIGGTFGWTTTPASGLTASCTLDGTPVLPCPNLVFVGPLAFGTHVFVLTVTGASGSAAAVIPFTWRVQPTLTVSGVGAGTVTSAPAGVACAAPSTCSAGFDAGTSVTLTAAPGVSSLFHGFTGCATTPTPTTCTVIVDASKSVTATFVPATVTLSVSVGTAGGAGGSIASTDGHVSCPAGTCSTAYPYGSTVSLTPTPNAISTFSSWGGACLGLSVPCSLTLTADTAVSAGFVRATFPIVVVTHSLSTQNIASGTITSTAGHSCNGSGIASVSCSATVVAGTPLTLTATPDPDSAVATWSGTPCAAGATTCTFTPTASQAINVYFGLAIHALTLHVVGSGSVTDTTNTIIACTAATSPCVGHFAYYTDVFLQLTLGAGATNWSWSGTGGASSCNTLARNPCQVTTNGDIDVTVTITP